MACCLNLEALEDRDMPSVYFVATGGNDTADGLSPETAWATANRVSAQDLEPGDQVLFHAGDSFGRLTMGPEDSGDLLNSVDVGSYGEGRAILAGLNSTDQSHARYYDLIFAGPGKYGNQESGMAFEATAPLADVRVERVESGDYGEFGLYVGGHGGGYAGFAVVDCVFHDCATGLLTYTLDWSPAHRDLLIQNVEAENCSNFGVAVSGVRGAEILFCRFHDIGWDYADATDGGPVGVMAYAADSVHIAFCQAYRVSNGTATYDGDGFDLDVGTTNSVIEYCDSHDCAGAGFEIYSWGSDLPSTGNVIRFNTSTHDSLVTGQGSYFAGGYVSNCSFEGNVSVDPVTGGPAVVWDPADVTFLDNSWQ